MHFTCWVYQGNYNRLLINMQQTTNTYRDQLLLMKRTAWRNMQGRKPTEADRKYIPTAVMMLTLVACLNSSMYDLEAALDDAGLMKHSNKRHFNMAADIVRRNHEVAYRMLETLSGRAAREYNDKLDQVSAIIGKCITLPDPEKSYSIVQALIRIIGGLNDKLTSRYDFAPARKLPRVTTLLSDLGISDRQIDDIILINLK